MNAQSFQKLSQQQENPTFNLDAHLNEAKFSRSYGWLTKIKLEGYDVEGCEDSCTLQYLKWNWRKPGMTKYYHHKQHDFLDTDDLKHNLTIQKKQ